MSDYVKEWKEASESSRALVAKLEAMRRSGIAVSDANLGAAESSRQMIALEQSRAVYWSREGKSPYYGG